MGTWKLTEPEMEAATKSPTRPSAAALRTTSRCESAESTAMAACTTFPSSSTTSPREPIESITVVPLGSVAVHDPSRPAVWL